MISALLSFLGGSVFRMIWGEVSALLTARQDHKHEVERMRLQAELEAAQHDRNLAALKMQADMGIQAIRVQGEQAASLADAQAFATAQAQAFKRTGIAWVDAWNAAVRPAFATVVLCLWVLMMWRAGFVPSAWDYDLMGGIAGFFFADRAMGKRGK